MKGQEAGSGSKREADVRPLRRWWRRWGAKDREDGSDWESPGEGWEWAQGRLGEEAEAQRGARTQEAGVTPGFPSGWSPGVSAPNPLDLLASPRVHAGALGWGPEAEA